MKKFTLSALTAIAALAFAAPAINAADGDDSAPPPPRREGGRVGGGARGGAGVQLSPEERQKLNAAVKEAQKADAVKESQKALQEAQKKFQEAQKKHQEALKAAVVKQDPSLKEIVEKYKDRPLPGSGAFGRGFGAGPAGERAQGNPPPRRNRGGAQKPASAENL